MDEPTNQNQWLEILKYPTLVFSMLLALIIARFTLGIQFGSVTEISKEGVKFEETASTALAEIDSRVSELETKAKEIQIPNADKNKVMTQSFTASQMVDNSTAQVALSSEKNRQDALVGYIWIGNYTPQKGWSEVNLAQPGTGAKLGSQPSEIRVNATYIVQGNMVVRDGLPADDEQYFRGRANLGVIPVGTDVEILEKPVGIEREGTRHYWAKLRVIKASTP
ncbi:MAG: hypothetical protein HC934_07100 [Acaryochloridaceae cyanobacterium SU_2_1]|nr:hypothetical protein [Acaryochloridaceae cyanobacterium SU_2_1]